MARQARETRERLIEESVWEGAASNSISRLLMGALESFADRGFHGTTTRDIASRARLSPAAVYVHYRSKEELLYLIMRITHEEILRQMQDASRRHTAPVDRIRALVKAHVVFHARRHTAARVANHELPALEPGHRRQVLSIRAEIEGLMERAILDGIASGDFHVDVVKATNFAILSLGIGVSRWFRPRGRLSPEILGNLYADLVAGMLAPSARRRSRARSGAPTP
jgi:AcrR family transcriptional regulator